MAFYELNQNLEIARENGFIINQRYSFKKKFVVIYHYKYTILFKSSNTNNAWTIFKNNFTES